MSYTKFTTDYKKNIIKSPLILYGAEQFLIDKATESIISKYVAEEFRNIDVVILDGEKIMPVDIISAAGTFSMLSDKRVVVVKNYLPFYKKDSLRESEELLKYISDISETFIDNQPSFIIFTIDSIYGEQVTSYAKKFIKLSNSYKFEKVDKALIKSLSENKIKKEGKNIGSKELEHLVNMTGYLNKGSNYDLNNLNNDLNKLIGVTDSVKINCSDIDKIFDGGTEKYVFDMVDALMRGNKTVAMDITENILREEDASMQLLALLTKQFEIMYDSLAMTDEGMPIQEVAKKTGVNDFRLKKAYQSALPMGIEKIKKALISLYNIDRDIKSGIIDRQLALELFVATFN